jgi:RimJ/RimL family protein N-acetyltransferase
LNQVREFLGGRSASKLLNQVSFGGRASSKLSPNQVQDAVDRCDRAVCQDSQLGDASFEIRPARDEDRVPLAVLFAAVAEERNGIAAEPPVDVDARAASWTLEGGLVAVAGDDMVGWLHVEQTPFGFGEIGMLVAREWRGRGVGSALLAAAIGWARERGLHKLSLSVFAHNTAAIALYTKCGFVEEGCRAKHFRRANGELWDALEMGLLL